MRAITRQAALKLIYTKAYTTRGMDYDALHRYIGDKYAVLHLKDACPYDLQQILKDFGIYVIVKQHPMITLCFQRAKEAGLSRMAVNTIARDRFKCSSIYTTIKWKKGKPDFTKLKGVVFKVIEYIKEKNEKEKNEDADNNNSNING